MNADVLVIGASVAGLTAARAAAAAGADTLLVERRPDVRSQSTPDHLAFDALWPPEAELEPAVLARYEAVRILGRDGALRVLAPCRCYDRRRLDEALASLARASGVRVHKDSEQLRPAPGGVSWIGGDAQGAVVIYADEANTLARHFVEPVRDPGSARFCSAWSTPAPAAKARDVEIAFGRHAPGGRSQWCPLDGGGLLTIHYQDPRVDPARLLDATLERHTSLRSVSPRECASLGPPVPDPTFTIPGQIAGDGLLVAGGAAGQGGLELAVEAGRMAGAAAAQAAREGNTGSARLLELYEGPWKRGRQRALERFVAIHERLVRGPAYRLEALVNAWSGATVPGRRLAAAAGLGAGSRAAGLVALLARHPTRLSAWAATVRLLRGT